MLGDHQTILVMALLVLIAPGALLLGCLDLGRRVPPLLVPASALAVSFIPIGLITAVQLWFHQPIRWSALLLAIVMCASFALWMARLIVATVRRDQRIIQPVVGVLTAPVSWLRGAPIGVLVIAAIATLAAWLSGERFYGDGDSYFHAALALKLQTLPEPSFWNIGQFRGGDNHPGYALPLWHEAIAIISRLADARVIETMRLLPVVIAPIAVLTIAGVARVAFRSPAAAIAAAAAFVGGRMLFTFPAMDVIVNAAEPRTVASGILIPLVLALVLVAVGRVTNADVGMRDATADSVAPWVPATGIAACATVVLTYVHVSYVVWLAMLMLGVAVVFLPRSWKTTGLRRTQLIVGASVFGAALIPMITLHGVIGRLHDDPQGGSIAGLALAGADVHRVLVGHGHWLHLRADYIIWFGAVAFLGLIGVVLLTRWMRDPLIAWIPVVGAIAGVSVLFPPAFRWLAQSIGAAQTSRVYLIFPWVFGVTAVVLLGGAYLNQLWKRGAASRVAAGGLVLMMLGGMVWLVQLWPALARRSAPPVMPSLPVTVLIVVCVASCLVIAFVSRAQPQRWPSATPWQQRGVGVVVVTLIVAIAPVPVLVSRADRVQQIIDTGPTSGLPIPGAGEVGVRTRRALAHVMQQRPHPVVLAEPHLAYRILALVPAYAAAVPPGHAAITALNRPYGREAAVQQFLRTGTSAADRLDVLRSEQVDVVVLRRRADQDAIRFALAHPRQLVSVGESPKLQTFIVRRNSL